MRGREIIKRLDTIIKKIEWLQNQPGVKDDYGYLARAKDNLMRHQSELERSMT